MCFHLFLGWTEEKKQFEIAIEIRFIFCEDKCKKKGEGKKGKGKVQFASVLNVEVLVESIRKRNNYLIESLVTLFCFLIYDTICVYCTAFFLKKHCFLLLLLKCWFIGIWTTFENSYTKFRKRKLQLTITTFQKLTDLNQKSLDKSCLTGN